MNDLWKWPTPASSLEIHAVLRRKIQLETVTSVRSVLCACASEKVGSVSLQVLLNYARKIWYTDGKAYAIGRCFVQRMPRDAIRQQKWIGRRTHQHWQWEMKMSLMTSWLTMSDSITRLTTPRSKAEILLYVLRTYCMYHQNLSQPSKDPRVTFCVALASQHASEDHGLSIGMLRGVGRLSFVLFYRSIQRLCLSLTSFWTPQ